MLKLIQHLVVQESGALPEISNCLYAYIMAGNGLFLYAKRPGLTALIPVSETDVRGLPVLSPFVELAQRVPKHLLVRALLLSWRNLPNELLFWFNLDQQWKMEVPQQATRCAGVRPLDLVDEKGTCALIDMHSHGTLPPFFSQIDDSDEQGFRIYAVIGHVDRAPSIKVRIGIYGYYFDVPASTVFEVPDQIADAYQEGKRLS